MRALIRTACAGAALLAAAPLMALLAWLIRLDDGGPVLFVQTRVGEGRRPFRIVKLRTMRDAQVTRVGRWLRATGLDELPQLWNVMRGDMAFVGPRPLTEADIDRLGWHDAAHAPRFACPPGVIGLAQLYAGRGKRLSWFLDVTYVERRTAGMDVAIIAATAAVALIGKRPVRHALRALRRMRRSVVRPHGGLRNTLPPREGGRVPRAAGVRRSGGALRPVAASQSTRSSSSGNRLGVSMSAN